MFDGYMGEVKVYSKVLSPQEIYQIYRYTRIDYLAWWRRLFFWLGETWLVIRGTNDI